MARSYPGLRHSVDHREWLGKFSFFGSMDRRITNIIRFLMDECLPPIVRDNKYFMYPFFWYAYRGKQLDLAMNFKQRIHTLSDEEYRAFYAGLDTISRNRRSDLNEPCITRIIEDLDATAKNFLDVGCGRGYLLSRLMGKGLQLNGCDTVHKLEYDGLNFREADICNLPFGDDEFDVVSCCHTLEHILDLESAVSELKRVAKKQLMIVVPCQRPYKYTLDEHVHFFTLPEQLTSLIDLPHYSCEKIWGDWLYIGSW